MSPLQLYLTVATTSAEDAHRFAQGFEGFEGEAGFAVGPGLLAATGGAVIAVLRETGPVLVDARLAGDPAEVLEAGYRLARYGAEWITVSATAGPQALHGPAAGSLDCRVAAATMSPGLDNATVSALTGSSRGRMVSRLAAVAAEAGVDGVVCALEDLGVVAQVAPGLHRLAMLGTDDELEEAVARGAESVVLASLPDDLEGVLRRLRAAVPEG